MKALQLRRNIPRGLLAALAAGFLGASSAPVKADELVHACADHPNAVFAPKSGPGVQAVNDCAPAGEGLELASIIASTAPQGATAAWQANAPTGLEIVGAGVSQMWS